LVNGREYSVSFFDSRCTLGYSLPEFSVAGGVVFDVEYGAVIVEKADVVSVIRRTQTYNEHD